MDYLDDHVWSEDRNIPAQLSNRQGNGLKTITTIAKATRAVTAIVFFGIPVVVGAATLLSYGAFKVYKRITKRS